MRGDHDRARMASGYVVGRDPSRMMVRIELPAHQLTTQWLRVLTPLASGGKTYSLPRTGDFVACLLDDSLNTGFVIGSAYTNGSKPSVDPSKPNAFHVTMDDGAIFEHDPDTSETLIDIPAGGSFTVRCGASSLVITDGVVTLTTPQFQGVQS